MIAADKATVAEGVAEAKSNLNSKILENECRRNYSTVRCVFNLR